MAKTIESYEKPEEIRVDIVKNGSARLQCRWDVREALDADGQTKYVYEEGVIWWALPLAAYVERTGGRQVISDAGRAYIAEHAEEIINWVLAAGV